MSRRSERLARVLAVRALEEEQARAEWLAAEQEARRAEDATQALWAARDEQTRELGAALPGLTPAWVMVSHGAIDRTERSALRQRERARTERERAEQARIPWEERRARARGLERLVDRLRTREEAEAHRAEARVLDEINSARALRARRMEARSER